MSRRPELGPDEHPLGLVETQQAELFTPSAPMHLSDGSVLPNVTVSYETYGTLNADRDNGIYICHALTGDAHVAGWHRGAGSPARRMEAVRPGAGPHRRHQLRVRIG